MGDEPKFSSVEEEAKYFRQLARNLQERQQNSPFPPFPGASSSVGNFPSSPSQLALPSSNTQWPTDATGPQQSFPNAPSAFPNLPAFRGPAPFPMNLWNAMSAWLAAASNPSGPTFPMQNWTSSSWNASENSNSANTVPPMSNSRDDRSCDYGKGERDERLAGRENMESFGRSRQDDVEDNRSFRERDQHYFEGFREDHFPYMERNFNDRRRSFSRDRSPIRPTSPDRRQHWEHDVDWDAQNRCAQDLVSGPVSQDLAWSRGLPHNPSGSPLPSWDQWNSGQHFSHGETGPGAIPKMATGQHGRMPSEILSRAQRKRQRRRARKTEYMEHVQRSGTTISVLLSQRVESGGITSSGLLSQRGGAVAPGQRHRRKAKLRKAKLGLVSQQKKGGGSAASGSVFQQAKVAGSVASGGVSKQAIGGGAMPSRVSFQQAKVSRATASRVSTQQVKGVGTMKSGGVSQQIKGGRTTASGGVFQQVKGVETTMSGGVSQQMKGERAMVFGVLSQQLKDKESMLSGVSSQNVACGGVRVSGVLSEQVKGGGTMPFGVLSQQSKDERSTSRILPRWYPPKAMACGVAYERLNAKGLPVALTAEPSPLLPSQGLPCGESGSDVILTASTAKHGGQIACGPMSQQVESGGSTASGAVSRQMVPKFAASLNVSSTLKSPPARPVQPQGRSAQSQNPSYEGKLAMTQTDQKWVVCHVSTQTSNPFVPCEIDLSASPIKCNAFAQTSTSVNPLEDTPIWLDKCNSVTQLLTSVRPYEVNLPLASARPPSSTEQLQEKLNNKSNSLKGQFQLAPSNCSKSPSRNPEIALSSLSEMPDPGKQHEHNVPSMAASSVSDQQHQDLTNESHPCKTQPKVAQENLSTPDKTKSPASRPSQSKAKPPPPVELPTIMPTTKPMNKSGPTSIHPIYKSDNTQQNAASSQLNSDNARQKVISATQILFSPEDSVVKRKSSPKIQPTKPSKPSHSSVDLPQSSEPISRSLRSQFRPATEHKTTPMPVTPAIEEPQSIPFSNTSNSVVLVSTTAKESLASPFIVSNLGLPADSTSQSSPTTPPIVPLCDSHSDLELVNTARSTKTKSSPPKKVLKLDKPVKCPLSESISSSRQNQEVVDQSEPCKTQQQQSPSKLCPADKANAPSSVSTEPKTRSAHLKCKSPLVELPSKSRTARQKSQPMSKTEPTSINQLIDTDTGNVQHSMDTIPSSCDSTSKKVSVCTRSFSPKIKSSKRSRPSSADQGSSSP